MPSARVPRRQWAWVLLLAAACMHPDDRPGALVPVVRVADLVAQSDDPRVRRGVDVALDREIRRAVSSTATMELQAELVDGLPFRRYIVPLPPAVRTWGQAYVSRQTRLNGRAVTVPPLKTALPEQLSLVTLLKEDAPRITMLRLRAADTPDLHDVTTGAFDVPAGAVLAFGVGLDTLGAPVETDAWIVAVDGDRENVLWRRRLGADDGRWSNERADLTAYAGRSVRLRFVWRPASIEGSAVVFGEPVVLARRPPVLPTNVVLISMDTLRARSVSAQGCPLPTSPTLDALARDGVRFDNATSTSAWTLPGHISMMTGLWERTHGVRSNLAPLPGGIPMLPERLRDAGYATAAFTASGWVVPEFGFRRGFDAFCEESPEFELDPPGGIPHRGFTRGLDWMGANRDRPTFLFLHSYRVHAPYRAPLPYGSLWMEDAHADLDHAERRYEREVRYGDDQILAFLEGLEAIGVADRTLVILTSDHGEAFGEHGTRGHQTDVHDEIARIPLIMRLPGAFPRGRVVDEPVSLADLAPTTLDLLGLAPMTGTDGASLIPLLTGATDRLARDGVITEAESVALLPASDLVAAHTTTHTCIARHDVGSVDCWDQRVDPWQRFEPLPAADPAPDAARALLARFAPDPVARHAEPTQGMTGAVMDGLGEERREQLRALGYLD